MPVEILDVAGLVPGASEGAGLGNRFLNDLRSAHVLLHVIDASGMTNEKGESTSGYDPLKDVAWLRQELHQWILGNLRKKWPSLIRRQTNNKLSNRRAVHGRVAGYGVTLDLVRQVFHSIPGGDEEGQLHAGIKRLSLREWQQEHQDAFVESFLAVRFPTILVLNKADAGSADTNIARITRQFCDDQIVISSAKAECTLKRLSEQRYVHYLPGSDTLLTAVAPDPSDEFYLPDDAETAATRATLRLPDPATLKRIERITDLILFRHGGTGTQLAIQKAVDKVNFVPVFPVKNLKTFSSSDKNNGAFRDCFLVRPGSTLTDLAKLWHPGSSNALIFAEDFEGRRLPNDYVITNSDKGMIIRLVVAQ